MSKNGQAIYRGFLRLHTALENTASEGIRRVGEAGLDLVVQFHNEHDSNLLHVNEDDTLSYAVARDGVVFSSGWHRGGGKYDNPGEAEQQAREIASHTKGFSAVVLSDMAGPWYDASLELSFLYQARDEIESRINEFFNTSAT